MFREEITPMTVTAPIRRTNDEDTGGAPLLGPHEAGKQLGCAFADYGRQVVAWFSLYADSAAGSGAYPALGAAEGGARGSSAGSGAAE